jgi:hypothetical protein
MQVVLGSCTHWPSTLPGVPLTTTPGFLYSILGWSALVGLAVMVALIPIPAMASKLLNGVQKKKMAAVSMTWNLHSLSMILTLIRPMRASRRSKKLWAFCEWSSSLVGITRASSLAFVLIEFAGWESRVKEQIDQKREEELKWVFQRKMLGLVNVIVNYVRLNLRRSRWHFLTLDDRRCL